MNDLLLPAIQKSAQNLDPYYNLVSLHLKGDVNTGRTYNAFSDASSNNFRLTNNGDVRGSSFSPYGTSWSGFFGGGYITVPSGSAVTPTGTQSYCLEFFAYITGFSGTYDIFVEGSTNTNGFQIAYFNDGGASQGKLGVAASGVGSVNTATITGYLNKWVHVVATRSGNDHRLFFDGVLVAYASNAISFGARGTQAFGAQAAGTLPIDGYMSNIRVCLDAIPTSYQTSSTTVGTSVFSAVTSPLTTSSQGASSVALIACHANRFIDRDNGAGTVALTLNGTLRISSFSPFLETDTTTGSGYFDGNADDLSIATNAAFTDLPGDWTIECWFYSTSTSGQSLAGTSSFNSSGFFLELNYTAAGRVSFVPVPWGNRLESSSSVFTINTWNHIAFVRSGTTVTIYVNGTSVASGTRSVTSNSQPLTIGQAGNGWDARYYFNGYISDFRIVKGAAVYTGAFTPPTKSLARSGAASASAYPSTTNVNTTFAESATSLLTLQERGAYNTIGFQDESEYQHVITRNGNVAQGTFSPFSNAGWAVSFGGGASNINLASSTDFALGGAFSFECWVYQTSIPNFVDLLDVRTSNEVGSLGISATGFPRWQNGPTTGSLITGSTALTLNQWNYLLFVADASGCSIYLNGQRVANTAQVATWPTAARPCFIGGSFGNASGGSLNGFVADARLIKGSTPYSSTATSVTVPTALLPFVTNTVLQCCRTSRFANTVNGASMTANGTTSVAAFSPFKPVAYDPAVHGGSGYFDGTGDYINLGNQPGLHLGSGDYTVELWMWKNTNTAYMTACGDFLNASTNTWQMIGDATGTKITWYNGASMGFTLTSVASIPIMAWTHIAFVRLGTTLTLYINGVSDSSTSLSTNYNDTTSFFVGHTPNLDASRYWNGYISGFRLVKGTAVYTSNFTPPSGPLPLISNTSLLLNFTNGGVIDSTGKNVIETIGNAGVVTTAIKKYGSGSLFFDGTGDYLQSPDSELVEFGSGDFTIETWVRFAALPSPGTYYALVSKWDNSTQKSYVFYVYNLSGAYQLYFTYTTAGSTNINPVAAITPSINTWYHYAVSRSGANLRMFIDGTQVGSTYNIATDTIFGGTYPLQVGAATGANVLNGNLDDVRITRGYARYTTGTGANANQMVFTGTNTLALPTKAHPDRGTASTLTTSMAAPSTVEALLVGGGGAGGSAGPGAGGGAGGFREFIGGNAISVSANTNYSLTVGIGGPGLAAGGTSPSNGNNTVFSSFIATGGGGGGGNGSYNGGNGGSSGGGAYTGIAGIPTPSPTQGNTGGIGSTSGVGYGGGGGGGAGGPGSNGSSTSGGAGGAGASSSITGVSVIYAAGGGGGARETATSGGTGGSSGIGGAGVVTSNSSAGSGTANTGSGGGGLGTNVTGNGSGLSGSGGSGVVILAYPTSFRPLKASLGLAYTIDTVTRPGYRVYKFTSGSGSISW